MAENKYKQSESKTRLTATNIATTKSKDHSSRKNQGSAEFFRKQRKERNAERGPQSKLIVAAPEGEYAIRARD